MPRVLKSSNVTIDENNKVRIKTSFFDKNLENLTENIEQTEGNIKLSKNEIMSNAYVESEKILLKARKECEKIINEKKKETDNILKQMKIDNEKIGYEDGYNKGIEASEVLKQEANDLLVQAEKEKEELMNTIEPQFVELTIAILDKLICKSYKINKNLIVLLIKQALQGEVITGEISLRVSEEDYPHVFRNKNEILVETEGSVTLEILKDYSLDLNDCIIETPFGDLDCSLKNQYETLKNDLYYLLESR